MLERMKGAVSLNHLVYPPRLFCFFFSSNDFGIRGELTNSPLDVGFCKESVAL